MAEIKILEYNLCVSGTGTDDPDDLVPGPGLAISNRAGKVFEIVERFGPDVAVFTEVNGAWWEQFEDFLRGPGACFDYYDTPTDFDRTLGTQAGLWDACRLIIYNREKFSYEGGGSFWVCATPECRNFYFSSELKLHASLVFPWVKLKCRTSGEAFCVLGVHPFANAQGLANANGEFGYTRQQAGEMARLASAKLVVSQMAEIKNEMPVIITGDFNSDKDEEAYKYYMAKGYEDAAELAPGAQIFKTYQSFMRDEDLTSGTPIDHVLVSEGDFEASEYKIITEPLNELCYPSDHFPVTVKLKLK